MAQGVIKDAHGGQIKLGLLGCDEYLEFYSKCHEKLIWFIQ